MFTVVAGKYEADGSRNYKYIETFATRQEAEEALAMVAGYPFSELEVDPAALLQESLDRAMELVNRVNERIDWHRRGKDYAALNTLIHDMQQVLDAEEPGF